MMNKYAHVLRYAQSFLCENRDYCNEIVDSVNFIRDLATRTLGKNNDLGEILAIAYCYNHSVWADDGSIEGYLNHDRIEQFERTIEQDVKLIDPRAYIRIQDISLKMDGLCRLMWNSSYNNLRYHCRHDVGLMILAANAVRQRLECANVHYEQEHSRYCKRQRNYAKRVYRKLINRIYTLATNEH